MGRREVVVEGLEGWFEVGYVGEKVGLVVGVGLGWGRWKGESGGIVGCGDGRWGWVVGKWEVLIGGRGECNVLVGC